MKLFPHQHQRLEEEIVSSAPLQQQQVYATATYLAIAAIAAAVGSTAVAYTGQKQQAKTAQAVSDYNANVEQNQAIQDDMNAQENEHRAAAKARLVQGSQHAAIAASGITEAGSPLEVLAYSAGQQQLQALDAQRDEQLREQNAFSGAEETRLGGSESANAYDTASYGTLLSGASKVAGLYGQSQYSGSIAGG